MISFTLNSMNVNLSIATESRTIVSWGTVGQVKEAWITNGYKGTLRSVRNV